MKCLKSCKFLILLTLLLILSVTSCGQTKQAFNELSPEEVAKLENLVAPDNTVLLGLNVSNQPFLVIKKIIVDENARINSSSFKVVGKNNTYEVNFADIDYVLNEDAIVDNIKNSNENTLAYKYDEQKLNDILNGIKNSENLQAKEASIKMEGGNLVTIAGVKGLLVNDEELFKGVNSVLSLEQDSFDLTFVESSPKYTEADFANFKLIGTYSTNYNKNATSRNKNLAQACNKINNVVVYPGEIFSTNDKYGLTTIANGYAVANVIVNNELVEGVGGGVCQISSTLYNTVLRAELQVVERRNHSLAVSYVPSGLDATLANPYIDFKFKNNQDTPILVVAGIYDGVATVSIYGHEVHSAGRTLKFRSELVSTINATMKEEEDNTLPVGTKKVEKSAVNGKVVKSYKDVYQDGKLIETIYLDQSTYSKTDGLTKVGTKQIEQPVTPPVEVDDTNNDPQDTNDTPDSTDDTTQN